MTTAPQPIITSSTSSTSLSSVSSSSHSSPITQTQFIHSPPFEEDNDIDEDDSVINPSSSLLNIGYSDSSHSYRLTQVTIDSQNHSNKCSDDITNTSNSTQTASLDFLSQLFQYFLHKMKSVNTPSTPSSSSSAATSGHNHSNAPNTSNTSSVPPTKALWFTPEFLVYYVVIFLVYYKGGGILLDVSNRFNAEPPFGWLRDGWIPGRKVDLWDSQYRFFRSQIPLLAMAAIIFVALSQTIRWISKNNVSVRLWFYTIFSFGFLLFCNGASIFFILAIVSINYNIGALFGKSSLTPWLTWIFNPLILLFNEKYHGYRYADVFFFTKAISTNLYDKLAALDTYHGIFPWYVLFNLVVLRMISFNMDRYWAQLEQPIIEGTTGNILTFEKHADKCTNGCNKFGREGPCAWWREKEHHALQAYNWQTYFTYLFYVPLHFAGPTITFNSFLSHVQHPQRSYDFRGLIKYTMRFLFNLLALEVWLHYCYVFTTNETGTFLRLSAAQMAMSSYFTLIAIWLKFVVIWRFFRCWALWDGTEAPENMNRCVSNNYSMQAFWRSWHRSFNRWLVRYIYVPLGGRGSSSNNSNSANKEANDGKSTSSTGNAVELSHTTASSSTTTGAVSSSSSSSSTSSTASFIASIRSIFRRALNVFCVFSFVAFWHDRTMQLLTWGWLVALLFIPEFIAASALQSRTFKPLLSKWYFRHVKGIFAALSIFLMMVANLIGYSVGIGGTTSIIHTLMTDGGIKLFSYIFVAFFSASQVMFELRRTGISVDQ